MPRESEASSTHWPPFLFEEPVITGSPAFAGDDDAKSARTAGLRAVGGRLLQELEALGIEREAAPRGSRRRLRREPRPQRNRVAIGLGEAAPAVEHRGDELVAETVFRIDADAARQLAARELMRLELAELEPHRQRDAFAEGEALAGAERGQEVEQIGGGGGHRR